MYAKEKHEALGLGASRNSPYFMAAMKPTSVGSADLLATPDVPELGPGPRPGVRPPDALRREVEAAPLGQKGDLLLGLVFLWHDDLDAAHAIAQDDESQDGSYLHAIMHRREPDYSNAKYWFRRVGQHPCFEQLAQEASRILTAARQTDLARKLTPSSSWDAFAFVDACESAAKGTSLTPVLREIQAAEMRIFFDYLASAR